MRFIDERSRALLGVAGETVAPLVSLCNLYHVPHHGTYDDTGALVELFFSDVTEKWTQKTVSCVM